MPRLRQILRDPLLHFLVIGVLLFVAYAALNPAEAPQRSEARVIMIDDTDIARIEAQFEKTWRRAPQQKEIDAMVDAFIRDEVLFREAMALSLDQGDTIIRQRLVQKMQFLLASAAGAALPDDDALQSYLEQNADRYTRPSQISFEQVYLGTDTDEAAAAQALAQLSSGAAPGSVGQQTLLPPAQSLAPSMVVDAAFGSGFYEQLPRTAGDWSGPYKSAYGLHLVRVTDSRAAALPDLDSLRSRLERDYQADKTQEQTAARIDALRAEYTVEHLPPAEASQ